MIYTPDNKHRCYVMRAKAKKTDGAPRKFQRDHRVGKIIRFKVTFSPVVGRRRDPAPSPAQTAPAKFG